MTNDKLRDPDDPEHPNARTRDCERLDHNQNDPERNNERHGAPISLIWVE